jgi:Fe-S cluster biogenesis protein NfuA
MIEIAVYPTPNPNCYKFFCPGPVRTEGKSTYKSPKEAVNNPLAKAIFKLRGIDTLLFSENYIVVTKFLYKDWDEFVDAISDCLIANFPSHNPNYDDKPVEIVRKLNENEYLLDQVLEKTIRPFLRADGGDIKLIALNGKTVELQYLGACNGCSSSSAGTLKAIETILKKEFSSDLEIKIV